MHLAELAGESGFTTLVGTGYQKDALRIFKVEIVANDRRPFRYEPPSQRDIEPAIAVNVFRVSRDLRITKFQTRASERFNVVKKRDVKLDLTFENLNRFLFVIGIPTAIVGELRKDLGIKLGDEL